MIDYESLILARQDALEIWEDEPDSPYIENDNFCSYEEGGKIKKCFDIPKEVAEKLLNDTERK